MRSLIQILAAEPDGRDGIIVKFSDGTYARYVVEELLELRPKRSQTEPLEIHPPEPTSDEFASSRKAL